MHVFVHALLMNAVLATLLALGVATVCLFIRQPSVTRFLWLLVLLRLAVPPLIRIPLPNLALPRDGLSLAALTEAELPLPAARLSGAAPVESYVGRTNLPQKPSPAGVAANQLATTDAAASMAGSRSARLDWRSAVLLFWGLGSLLLVAASARRSMRFSRWLRYATPVPQRLAARADDIASRLGLRSRPKLLIVAGRISPSVWAWHGRVYVLLPEALLSKLDPSRHDMLVAHELVHYRRRDHWCRWFEAALLAVYWWHPVAWWARGRVLCAEEECCDAWVLSLFPGRARAYAETLLATVDFLMPSPNPVAPAATGFGLFPVLKRRLEMILRHRPRHRTTPLAAVALTLAAFTVLTFSPVTRGERPAATRAEGPVATVTYEQDADSFAVPAAFDAGFADNLAAAYKDVHEKDVALHRSRMHLDAIVEKLRPDGVPGPAAVSYVADRLREFEMGKSAVEQRFVRMLAANDEVELRREAVGNDADSTNLFLNALQRKAEAESEYFAAVADLVSVPQQGQAQERDRRQWLTNRRLDAAVSAREQTLKVWQSIRSRREASGKGVGIVQESQARTQYWALEAIIDRLQAGEGGDRRQRSDPRGEEAAGCGRETDYNAGSGIIR